MTRTLGALLVVAVCLMVAAPASAQIVGSPFELSGHAGYFKPDDRARTLEGPEFGASIGWRYLPWLTLEGHALFAPSDADSSPGQAHNFSSAGLDLRFNLVPPENKVVPFVLVGGGYGLSHTTGTEGDKLERGAASFGLGAMWNVINQRTFIRAQVRDTWFRERGPAEFSNHFAVSVGLQYNLGGAEKDSDIDGVRDWLDRCPDTPLGARVDAHGCPLDGDKDRVYDGLDNCPESQPGCVVDSLGCNVDSDGDGVCDGLDQCADTPAGSSVDANGCPSDTDSDGVLDGIDQCNDTISGCEVDATGCSQDSDGDGVCDGIDQCPDTPDTAVVNAIGCPYRLSNAERLILETGRFRIDNVAFATARGDLEPGIFPVLDELGAIIGQYPQLTFELAGFTDDRGDSAAAVRMSLARSQGVLKYLIQKFSVDLRQVTAVGLGGAGSGDQARYVELRVVNSELLPAELLKRQPPDTTGTGTTGSTSPGSGTSPGGGAAPDTSGSGTSPGSGGAPPDIGGTGGSGAAPDTSGTGGSDAAPDTSSTGGGSDDSGDAGS